MKPSLILLLCFTFYYAPAFSQQTNLSTIIKLDQPPYTGNQKFPFSKFEVIDARQDTGKVGYFGHNLGYIHKLISKNGFTEEINNFLSGYYKPAFSQSDYSVLMVVKKLWVSQFDTTLIAGLGEVRSGKIIIEKIKLEFYLHRQDDYFTINRFDTSFLTTQHHNSKTYAYEIGDGLTMGCDKFFKLQIPEIIKKRKLSIAEIEKFNRRLINKPILQASSYNKGVYMSFEEFLNNQPSVSYNYANKKKFGDVLYLQDGSGNEYGSNNFWGYCDGKDIYITSGKNFFKLYRIQNTFEFYGIKNLRERFASQNDVTNFGEEPGKIFKGKPAVDKFFYQVDMETGETY